MSVSVFFFGHVYLDGCDYYCNDPSIHKNLTAAHLTCSSHKLKKRKKIDSRTTKKGRHMSGFDFKAVLRVVFSA